MEDPFKYVQNQQTQQQPVNIPSDSGQPPQAPISTLQQQAKLKRIALIVIIVLFTLFAAVGVYLVAFRQSPQETSQPQPAQAPAQDQQQPVQAPITQATENFSSSRLFLSFDYPADWTAQEEQSGKSVKVTSNQLALPGATSQTQGIVQMTIRASGSELPEFDSGNAVAVLPSEKISYSNPSPAQRGDTYLSYLAFAGSSAGLINGIYITGDFGYKQDQAIPKVDIEKIDPIVSVQFYACDGQCTQPTGVGRDLPETEIGQAIVTMLKSLRIN